MLQDIASLKVRLSEFNLSDISFVLPSSKRVIIQRHGPKFAIIGLGYECIVHSIDSLVFVLKSYDVPYTSPKVA